MHGCLGFSLPLRPADVTSGVNTREKLRERDSKLAELMTLVYGESDWRYPATAPRPFAPYEETSREKRQRLRAQQAGAGCTAKQPSVQVLVVPASGEVADAVLAGSGGASFTRRSRRREGKPTGQCSQHGGAPGGRLSPVSRRITRAFSRLAGCCLGPG